MRLFGFYVHSTNNAEELIRPARRDRAAEPPPGTVVRPLADRVDALRWLDSERPNLVPMVRAAAEHGFPDQAWRISRYLWGFFEARGLWADWIASHEIALSCTREVGDQLAQARILVGLGVAKKDLRRYDEAIEHYLAARVLMRAAGFFRSGEAGVLTNLGNTYRHVGRLAESVDCHQQQAVEISRQGGDSVGEAIALNNLGQIYRDAGRFEESVRCEEQALRMCRAAGDRQLEGVALDNLARAYLSLRSFDLAFTYARQGLVTCRAAGDRYGEAVILDCLARIYRVTDRFAEAADHWRQALVIAESLNSPLAADLRDHLDALSSRATVR
ncbi:tetratricopeptide repeat protein [Fodinicola feengrottensis]|uniref:tetratricopeptide repeat protein n=1 Tax=Fodinicola feengrottensis TaxID=435914 RepID=UPI0013D13079|nr:tetratricopeptide repeat protein [Fodinicola feengrottensis]